MNSTSAVDLIGFAASAATLVAFAQKDLLPMRISAIAANIFFLSYGALGSFYPVLLLHLTLLPLNLVRLAQHVLQVRSASGDRDHDRAQTLPLIEEWRRAQEPMPTHHAVMVIARYDGVPANGDAQRAA